MTSNDVRDMLDLPSTAGPRPAKKQKTAGPRPNLKGLQREVQSLGGNNPIAIVPEVPLFKKRRLASRKPAARWELKPFRNSVRDDDLILRHWRRKAEPPPTAAVDSADGESAEAKPVEPDDSAFAKFNVKVNLPKFDDEQYEANLKSENWTKEETNYLTGLVRDFDLRWPLIWDRYEYDPPMPRQETGEEGSPMVVEPKGRTMEDLKARYYDIAAKMMAVHRPVHNMSQAEFNLHQLMTSFNPQQEQLRKHFAEMSLARSPEERREEESLLIELKRIIARSERLNEERKELYARLDAPPSTANVGLYSSSAGLSQLLSQLVTANKSKQRRFLPGPEGASPIAGPSGQQSATLDRRDATNRESISGPSGANKKGAHGLAERRKLSPEEESLYGVSHHDRLTGGPSFRHDKVTRQISNKSVVQQAKITNTLVELEIPLRMTMPTAEVTAQYEQLLVSINILLDTKKVADKLDNEIKVIEMQKAEREKRERREGGEPEVETQVKRNASAAAGGGDEDITDTGTGGQGGGVGAGNVEADDVKTEMEQGEKERSVPRSAGGSLHKRSASVLSQMSDKSSKRQKK